MDEKMLQILIMLQQAESEELRLEILKLYNYQVIRNIFIDAACIIALTIAIIMLIKLINGQ